MIYKGINEEIGDESKMKIQIFLMTLLGMWTSTFYLGNFVAPTIAGFIVENFGFKSTTLVFFGFYAFIILLDSCQLAYILKYIRAPQREGYSDLDDNRNVQPSEPAVAE